MMRLNKFSPKRKRVILVALLVAALSLVAFGSAYAIQNNGSSSWEPTSAPEASQTLPPPEMSGLAGDMLYPYLSNLISQFPQQVYWPPPSTSIRVDKSKVSTQLLATQYKWVGIDYNPEFQCVTILAADFGTWRVYLESGQISPVDMVARLIILVSDIP